ncbi:putative capsular polysaccharide biosynthesis protein [Bordetella avium 197N]|uniref:Capsular polysaccharide biosynthesis protein n=2 Tax=Bordetella avium TaxID=521 RepID=Q2KWN5_BORA1|nr:putative capsular polysaccharide biosynthesis protein [Bordetella avium 197N]
MIPRPALMNSPCRVAAQISMYPMDYPHAALLLPHQIRVWSPMVDRIVVTLDTHRSRSGRYRGRHFDEYRSKLLQLARELQRDTPKLEVIEVDYAPEARREVAQAFFGLDDIPVKAWDGGPFYAYFYGMHHSRARHIVHFDGDMLFGGGSQHWVEEAIAYTDQNPSVLLTGPFPGPPAADAAIFGHGEPPPERIDVAGAPAYRFQTASTRIFMLDMERLRSALGVLPLLPPSRVQSLKSHLLGNPPLAREAEVILGEVLRARGLYRVDLLGSAPGLWSLHPPYRGADFYEKLPQLIAAVESGQLPDAQRGHYDVHDSVIDWSSQRALNQRHKRWLRLLKDRLRIGG